MRTPHRFLAVVAGLICGGCATSDVPGTQYDEVARIVSAGLVAPNGAGEIGALTDSAMLARDQLPAGFERDASGVVSGRHGMFTFRYFAVCSDANLHAVAGCGPTTERALVIASWEGPVNTVAHQGMLRRGGYWTVSAPWRSTSMMAGHTWIDYDAGTYRLEDERDMLVTVEMAARAITAGGMSTTLTVYDGTSEPQEIYGDIALTFWNATIDLDGVTRTEVNLAPILIR
jgi:hypothetical protein